MGTISQAPLSYGSNVTYPRCHFLFVLALVIPLSFFFFFSPKTTSSLLEQASTSTTMYMENEYLLKLNEDFLL